MRKIINGTSIELGTCYYPEHWDKSMWDDDLSRMKEVGIRTVRIAEFAWNKVEPREGEYTYGFFDEFLDLAYEKGMKVIFCTPSATPPAWLTSKYPETLNANRTGQLYEHGSRRHYNYNSPIYQEKVANITERFAAHFAKHPAIIGWQIDNELNCETDEFYSDSDTVAFRGFLKARYGTIDILNTAWGTVFWNQTYNDWNEITLPGNTIFNTHNPHKLLDYSRFVSKSARSFCKMQSDILRKYIKPDDFITTNGFFGNLDYHKLNRESLDFMTYDSYPNFGYCIDGYNEKDPFKDMWSSCNLAEVRAMSGQFGIMEQQSGANGWYNRMEAPTPKPGQMTLWTMQSIAHGADYISYFRWRTCTFGTEMYWHGILDYSGRENRRLREVADIHKKLSKIQEIAGSKFVAKIAIVKDYDNEWDARYDNWHSRVSKVSHDSWVMALQESHTPYDYLYLYDNNIWKGIYNRDFLVKNEIYFNESIGAAFQDIGFMQLVLACANRVMYINKSFYRYRIGREMSSVNSVKSFMFVYQEFYRLLNQQNLYKKFTYCKGLYIRMVYAVLVEYSKVLKITGYDMESKYIKPYDEWFHSVLFHIITQNSYYLDSLDIEMKHELCTWLYQKELFISNIKKNAEKEEHFFQLVAEKNVYIFGAGNMGKNITIWLLMRGIVPICICDNNPKNWGKKLVIIDILSPEKGIGIYKTDIEKKVFIIANKYYYEEIEQQLLLFSIPKDQIIKSI